MPVAPRSGGRPAARTGNGAGVVVVRLPLEPADPQSRLAAVHRASERAKRGQVPVKGAGLPVRPPLVHLARAATRHQHLTNTVVSNVVGPTKPLHLLGVAVVDLVPLGALAGNLAVSFLASSYAGTLAVTVRADADRLPDTDALVESMAADWRNLARTDTGLSTMDTLSRDGDLRPG
jgi:hypothetical protein